MTRDLYERLDLVGNLDGNLTCDLICYLTRDLHGILHVDLRGEFEE